MVVMGHQVCWPTGCLRGICTDAHDNTLDARAFPAAGNWAAQIARQCRALQLPAPFAADGSGVITPISYRSKVLQRSEIGRAHMSLLGHVQ